MHTLSISEDETLTFWCLCSVWSSLHSCNHVRVQRTCRTELSGSHPSDNQRENVATAQCLQMTITCLLKTRLITGGQHATTHTHTEDPHTCSPNDYPEATGALSHTWNIAKTSQRWTRRGLCVEIWVKTKECHHLMINYGVNRGWSVGRLSSHTHKHTHPSQVPIRDQCYPTGTSRLVITVTSIPAESESTVPVWSVQG